MAARGQLSGAHDLGRRFGIGLLVSACLVLSGIHPQPVSASPTPPDGEPGRVATDPAVGPTLLFVHGINAAYQNTNEFGDLLSPIIDTYGIGRVLLFEYYQDLGSIEEAECAPRALPVPVTPNGGMPVNSSGNSD